MSAGGTSAEGERAGAVVGVGRLGAGDGVPVSAGPSVGAMGGTTGLASVSVGIGATVAVWPGPDSGPIVPSVPSILGLVAWAAIDEL